MTMQFGESLVQLGREVAAKIKAMLGRGDSIDDIAVYFGVNTRVVHAVAAGAVHPFLEPAPLGALPERGPYTARPSAYRALHEVRDAERRLQDVAVDRNK